MSSLFRKKKIKFSVELTVTKLTDVPLLNAVIFAKVRLLDCGSFGAVTLHRPVCSHEVDFMSMSPSPSSQYQMAGFEQIRARTMDHLQCPSNGVHRHSVTGFGTEEPTHFRERRHSLDENCTGMGTGSGSTQGQEAEHALIEYEEEDSRQEEEEVREYINEDGYLVQAEKNPQPFKFSCCIPFDSKQTGVLEDCRLKISLRKEDRAGRSPEKLGFVILNLTEFAYSGAEGITRSYLVDGYDNNQRADNSRVHIFVRMQHNSADPLFTIPNSSSRQIGSSDDPLRIQELNPADRKAPPASPIPNSTSAGQQGTSTNSTVISQGLSAQLDSLFPVPSQMVTSTSTISSHGVGVCTYSTVPGGFGHNMSTRVQQTRRDPIGIIDEVLAENSATIARKSSVASSSSSSTSAEYQSS